jgi:hypothetical protein
MDFKETLEFVQNAEKEGRITIATIEGLSSMLVDDISKQPVEGLLYDLNRDKVTSITLGAIGEKRWVNDYAVAVVIEKLMQRVRELEHAIAKTIELECAYFSEFRNCNRCEYRVSCNIKHLVVLFPAAQAAESEAKK